MGLLPWLNKGYWCYHMWEIWSSSHITQRREEEKRKDLCSWRKEMFQCLLRLTDWMPLRHDYSVFKWIVSCPPLPSPQARSSGQVTASGNVSHLPNASWTVAASSGTLASYSGRKSPFVQLAFRFQNLFYQLNGGSGNHKYIFYCMGNGTLFFRPWLGSRSWVKEV